ncbi:MAG: LptF/LptG family permease [Gemmatimonadota bacterium]
MRLITRHILRALAAPFFWGIVALTGLLLLNQISELINQFGGKGLSADVMVEAVVLALPALLTLTLPMAVLVSTLYAYSQLAADQEMVAMYANGISVWRMVRPALLAACVVAVVNFMLFDQVVPRSNIRFRSLKSDVMQKTPTLALRPVLLNPLPPTSYILRAAAIDDSSGEMRDVTIYDLSSYEGRKVLHAETGRMAESPSGTDLLLTLRKGDQLDIKSTQPGRIERTQFEVNRIRIRGVANQLERRDDELERGDREMSGCELLDGVTEQRWQLDDINRQREFATRRDLRHLAGLSPVPAPSAQLQPEFQPHCGRYRDFEDWVGRVMVPPSRRPRDSLTAAPASEIPVETLATKPESTAQVARLPQGISSINPPVPQPLPLPVPAPAVTAPPPAPSPAQDSASGVAAAVRTPADSSPPRAVKKLRDIAPSATAESGAAILKQVVPPEQHTPSADSAYALALRQRAMNTPAPAAAGQLAPEATPPQGEIAQPQAQGPPTGFLVPPQVQSQPNNLIGTIAEVRGNVVGADRALSMIRQYQVEYHKKFSIPLASFCFVLLGVALALKYPRSGIGLVIAASLIIFMAFYVLLIGGENVANKGYISAALAMHGPVVLFTIFGLLGVILANREMGTARTGGILDALVGLFGRPFRRKR